ncbi:MAG: 5-formyltetrahydrofolate cyclo-ligase, partial [Spirochaetales bacterium]|nr:5-formyltetrahydrofolate cyclo-ligase [Spirochaetales bacterium]
ADANALALAKAAMRSDAKRILAGMGEERRDGAGVVAAGLAAEMQPFVDAVLVLAFLSMPTEIDTSPLIGLCLDAGKRVAVPRIDGPDIAFVELAGGWQDWPRDRWNIPAPPGSAPTMLVEQIAVTPTLAIVPGLAFDERGGRLGRGKGYYDRFLSAVAAARARLGAAASPFHSLGYGCREQLVALVPTGRSDVPLDGLALG